MNDIRQFAEIAEHAARAAGAFLRGHRATLVASFGKDTKIDADMRAHTLIVEHLAPTGIPVLSEEGAEHTFTDARMWVVDPLDGSINFLRGIPNAAVSIALVERGEPVFGVIYDFMRDELYSGVVGGGAQLNGKDISVSDTRDKREGIIMTGFPSYTDYAREALEQYIALVQGFKKVRLIGSAALSLAYVASGKADAYYEKDIKIWDVAAGLALVRAAGGSVTASAVGEAGKCTVFAGNGAIVLEG